MQFGEHRWARAPYRPRFSMSVLVLLVSCAPPAPSGAPETVFSLSPPTWFEDGFSYYDVSPDGSRALYGARFGMRLVHYSVQSNHLHLIVEAADRRALTRGMQGLAIRLARRINASSGRRGRLFNDRYHARALRTPLEVRRVLVYVLRNDQRHWAQGGLSLPPWDLDPCSSASIFDGFLPLPGLAMPPPEEPSVTVAPMCLLLRRGWKRHGRRSVASSRGTARSWKAASTIWSASSPSPPAWKRSARRR